MKFIVYTILLFLIVSCNNTDNGFNIVDPLIVASEERFWRDADSNVMICNDTIYYYLKNEKYHGYLSLKLPQDMTWQMIPRDNTINIFKQEIQFFLCGDIVVTNLDDFKIPLSSAGYYRVFHSELWLDNFQVFGNDSLLFSISRKIRL